MSEAAKRSTQLFDGGLYCAESVLLAVAEHRGLDSELIPRIATGLGAGLARNRGLCGAVSGAILAISLFEGRDSPDQSVEPCFDLVTALLTHFTERFGAINCFELTGCDLATPDGKRAYDASDQEGKCSGYVEAATSKVIALLDS